MKGRKGDKFKVGDKAFYPVWAFGRLTFREYAVIERIKGGYVLDLKDAKYVMQKSVSLDDARDEYLTQAEADDYAWKANNLWKIEKWVKRLPVADLKKIAEIIGDRL